MPLNRSRRITAAEPAGGVAEGDLPATHRATLLRAAREMHRMLAAMQPQEIAAALARVETERAVLVMTVGG